MENLAIKNGVTDSLQTGLYQYALVVQPASTIVEKVEQEKDFFYKHFNDTKAEAPTSLLAVAGFQARDRMEETLVRYMERVTSTHTSFTIALNNFSGIPSRTIFIRVQNPQAIRQLNHQLTAVNSYMHSCSCPAVSFVANPHLVIADNLSEVNYLQAMFEYSQRSFFEIFMVSELVLVRRSHQFDAWKKLHVFRLQPAAYTAFQNNLFN